MVRLHDFLILRGIPLVTVVQDGHPFPVPLHPFPVPLKTYDETIQILQRSLEGGESRRHR
jgi:hypothetical protein